MTDIGRTQPLEHREPVDLDRDGVRAVRAPGDEDYRGPLSSGPGRDLPDPVAAAKDPTNRAKLLLATAAMTLLNLVLLLVVLANVLGDGAEEVVVDGVPCLIAESDGENVLYCAR